MEHRRVVVVVVVGLVYEGSNPYRTLVPNTLFHCIPRLGSRKNDRRHGSDLEEEPNHDNNDEEEEEEGYDPPPYRDSIFHRFISQSFFLLLLRL